MQILCWPKFQVCHGIMAISANALGMKNVFLVERARTFCVSYAQD